jgi:hydrogenase nickel incorporation protein HypA/HybF
MHELAVVEDMLAVVDAGCERSHGRRVLRVVLVIGKDSGVLPDAVRFCFEVATEGTVAEGATLDIVEPAGTDLLVKEIEVV